MTFFVQVPIGRGKGRVSRFFSVSSYKGTELIMKASLMTLSNPNYLRKSPSPNNTTLGGRASTCGFGGGSFQSITPTVTAGPRRVPGT